MASNYIYKNTVQPSWIDHNDHMHDAKYYAVFSDTVGKFFESLNISVEHRHNQSITIFSLESHISFLKELRLGESFHITTHIYNYDAKRVHLFLIMHNIRDLNIIFFQSCKSHLENSNSIIN